MLFWTALITALVPAVVDFLKSDSGKQMIAGHQQMMGGMLQNLGTGGPLAGLFGGGGGPLAGLFAARQDAAGGTIQSMFAPTAGPGGLFGGGPLSGILGGN